MAGAKNLYGKARKGKDDAYAVYASPDGSWVWYVLKLYKTPEATKKDPYGRVFTLVTSPFVPDGELGDTYAREIANSAVLIKGEDVLLTRGTKLDYAAGDIPETDEELEF